MPNNIEAFFMEMKVIASKWLVCCSYNHDEINVCNHFEKNSKTVSHIHQKV